MADEQTNENWACPTSNDLIARGIVSRGVCLLLGAADTGKTSLATALADGLSRGFSVAFIDADIGQSHIGPPTTIGCAMLKCPCPDLSALTPEALAFVGDITPVGHLLQFAAALERCLAAIRQKADIIIIDTPGLAAGGAAAALWWAVYRTVSPSTIVALQRRDELEHILAGLDRFDMHIERLRTPPALGVKTPEQRRRHRLRCFAAYFRDATVRSFDLAEVAVQSGRNPHYDCAGRLVALTDKTNSDIAIGVISAWDAAKRHAAILMPPADLSAVRCLVIGDASIEKD